MPFPLTLSALKEALQIPVEATDQDRVCMTAVEVARAIVSNYIGPDIADDAPSDSVINVRTAATLIAVDFIHHGGLNFYGTKGERPIWMGLLKRESHIAAVRALYPGAEPPSSPADLFASLRSTLRASDGIILDFDPTSQTVRITPNAGADFVRRMGWAADSNITAAVIGGPLHVSDSNTKRVVFPTMNANGFVWLWLGRPDTGFERILVSATPGGEPTADARSAFGSRTTLTYQGVIGSLYVTRVQQLPEQWSERTIYVE